MKNVTKEILAAFPQLAKSPSLAVSMAALVVPVVMLWAATKFVSASVEAIIFMGALSVCVLGYCVWVVYYFRKVLYENYIDDR